MTSSRHLDSAAEWRERIAGIAGRRCDLEMLLRDEWRHRIAVRDDGSGLRATHRQDLVLVHDEHGIPRPAGRDAASPGALALAVLHSVLHAYGHGHQTVVAFLDLVDAPDPDAARVLPVVVDHVAQARLTCAAAVEAIDEVVRDRNAYLPQADLLQHGLFDALVVLADRDLVPEELPACPLVVVVRDDPENGRTRWTLWYAGDLFEDKIVVGLLDVAREVHGQFSGRPEQLVSDIDLLSAEQELQLLRWNDTDGDFPTDTRLDELFEAAVRRFPDAEAVVCGEVRLTYREVSERANQVANWLLRAPVRVRVRDLVGLLLDKSDLGVSLTVGIWRAGAAYVPIDPAYPAERVRFIVGDTGLRVVLTNRRHVERLRDVLGDAHPGVRVVAVEDVLVEQEAAGRSTREHPGLALSAGDIAYATYTSGTTGVPKGVPKFHDSVVNSITDLSERYDMLRPGEERVALFASYVFEPHLRQTLIALLNGHTLVVVPDDVRLDPDRFPDYVERHGVTYLNATGSVLQHFDLSRCPSLRKLMLVGEELTAAGLRRLRERFGGLVVNEYAFTEAAFVTAVKEFPPGVVARRDRSIGRPVRNVKWYVLSQDLKQLPIGALGELYIGGRGVAPGYLNRDDLTAERFTANPFQSERERERGENGRLYRTGDLARMLPNGEVEFMGRSDFQLKLNGVRVEPGEIEARTLEYPGVRACVVVAREGRGAAGRYLVGYYVADDEAGVTEADLVAFLETRLIRIMVPARMVRMPALPVNVNGKVDWRALPEVDPVAGNGAPATSPAASPVAADTPVDDIAGALRDIWAEVLGVPADRVDDQDDFFRLGGQSISCILLIARVRQRFGRAVEVADVFRLRTLAGMTRHLVEQRSPAITATATDPAADTGGEVRLPANGLQQGLYYHALRRTDEDDAYVMQSVHHYRCRIDPDLMREAWQHARRRYPSLRLRFEWVDEPVQVVVDDDAPVDWRYLDLTDLADDAAREEWIRRVQERDRAEHFDLDRGGLFRVYLVKQRDDLFTLVFSCHHVILDGWSLPVLHDEVHRAYLRLVRGLPVERASDTAYVAAQRYWAERRGDHADYWVGQIARIDERGDFAGLLNEASRYQVSLSEYDHVREHRTRRLGLGAERTAALKAACAAERVTLHSVLQFVWHRVLHAIGGGTTTVVGTIVSGRNLPIDGVEDSVGLFINTLPLVVDHRGRGPDRVADVVRDIQDLVNTMNDRSIVELGRLESGERKRSLFDTLLVLENYPDLLAETEHGADEELLRFEKAYDSDKVDYPIAVVAREEGDELTVTLWYAGELFDDSAVDTLVGVTDTLFAQVARDLGQRVADLDPVPPAMLARYEEWNRTDADFPGDKTLHGVFEEVAARWPDEVAVVYRDTRLTYREVNERANRLAHHLRAVARPRPDDIVALVLDKDEAMMVAIIAAWKTGGAYVPVDPAYPDDRVAFMLSDTAAKVVLTNEAHADRLRPLAGDAPVLAIEGLRLDHLPAANPVTDVTSTDLAYAIYTSGTTGRPKAVLVEHRGVVNLQWSLSRTFSLSKEDGDEAFLSFSNYIFDHFVEQFTDALLNGQKLVVLDDTMRADEARLCRYLTDERVTYLSGTPSVLSLYDFTAATSLTRVDAIGEDFTEPVFDKIRRTYPGTVINGYGPTEISITSHKRPYPPGERRVNKSIGLPLANYHCYVLDGAMRRVPIGGVGELYIGGAGVARGYLNRPDLTAERFLDNPFRTAEQAAGGENARMYKTGDLVRWLPNGEVEYLGRTDLQVKIRGQRVELGEVEAALSSYPGVTRALVVARTHTGSSTAAPQKYLVGFYIADREFAEPDLKEWMRGKLPEAVVPARVIRIDDIPVTPSGKLDVRRLPETEFGGDGAGDYAPPSGDVEVKLCGIWSRVLGVAPDRIGAHDDFFSLGGDSIRAMSLAQGITTGFGSGLGVATVLRHTTLSAQAKHIAAAAATLDAEGVEGAAGRLEQPPVSPAQERLLFIDDFEGGTAAYNIPFTLRLADEGLTAASVTAAVRALVRRHPALRTLLAADVDGVLRQRVLTGDEAMAAFTVPVHVVGTTAELDALLVARSGHVFRTHEELPILADLVELAGARYLGLVLHHTCFDGWSWGVFRRELAALLAGAPESDLPRVRASYGDFAVWQRRYLSGRRLAELTGFWRTALDGFETIRLPLDHPRPARFDHRGRELEFAVDAATTEALRELARSTRVSLYAVLLSAWYLVLAGYTGRRDLVVGTPWANRGRPEFDHTVGFFANLLALRVRVEPDASVRDHVRAVGEAVLAAQVHGELPFEQLVKELAVRKDPSRHPVVQVNFTLQNAAGDPTGPDEYLPDADGWTATKFDLSTTLWETRDGLRGNLTFAASLFEDATARGIADTFRHVLAELTRPGLEPDRTAVAAIGLVEPVAEPEPEPSEPKSSEPKSSGQPAARRTMREVFAEVAATWPDEVAVVDATTRLTYRELDARANRLAHDLRAAVALSPGDLVALVLDQSAATVVAVLAVWKAGAAYLPVDPGSPDDRVAFMLTDTGARAVVAGEPHADRLRAIAAGIPVLAVDRPAGGPEDEPRTAATAADPAYAIYTSGTTGRPKAVLVTHASVDSFREQLAGRYFGPPREGRQGVLMLANYVFDFSVEQLALSVLGGHKLIVPSPSAAEDPAFYVLADREGLSYVSGTPTQVQRFDLTRLPHLRAVLVAGEVFGAHHFSKIRAEFAGTLYNAYGTTETTVYNTVQCFAPGAEHRNALGHPLGNTRMHVLGHGGAPLPAGAVGELHVAGECVAAGYLNRPELTGERFVPNPFRTDADRAAGRFPVLYRTGDVVRVGPDGGLRFLGRNDDQVKINGVRVEPGEVEAALAACPGVRQCAVVAGPDGRTPDGRRLIGYYLPDDGAEVTRDDVLAALRARLAPSMVPGVLIRLDGPLPTTITGKLDTAALPQPDAAPARAPYAAPRDRVEARLCRLWGARLPVESVGIDDDFFRCGGDSISALHLASGIQRELGRRVGVKEVFDFPTVRRFAAHAATAAGPEEPEEGRPGGEVPLLPVQEWFFAKPLVDRDCWNQHFAVRTPPLDPDRLRAALAGLVDHHDAFRLRYPGVRGGAVRQVYADGDPGVVLHELDVRGRSDADVAAWLEALQHGFDLEHGPIAVAAHLHGFPDGSTRVWFAAHHLVVDTVSWRILAQDLEVLYHGGVLGRRTASYQRWSRALRDYRPAGDERRRWVETVHGMALDVPRREGPARHEEFALSPAETQALLTESSWAYDTEITDVLLTATAHAVRAVTGLAVNHVTVEGHGRELFDGAPDVRDTVGWFTTMHPVAVVADPDDPARGLLATRDARRLPHHGIGYGALFGRYGGDRAPLPPVTFNYLGRLDGADPADGDAVPTAGWHLDPALSGSYHTEADADANDAVVDVTMSCVAGRLVTRVDSRMGERATRAFTDELATWLARLIAHTSAAARDGDGRARRRAAAPTEGFEPYLLVEEDAERTIFLLPPGEGGAESYLGNLARRLPGHRLVLFNNVHLHTPMASFEDLGRYYLDHVRRLQPEGPYAFLGWSFGGVLALEMSRQLALAGERVEHLVLIDPYLGVPRASAAIGLPDVEDVLDPINFHYRPAAADLARLADALGDVVLFKAGEVNDVVTDERQSRIFAHYQRTAHNHLDLLVPAGSIETHVLDGATHHSWVHHVDLVTTICDRVLALLAGSRSREAARAEGNGGPT
ncbi:amino acid adenylation domain-containing protein [Saccharothrix lopnurensis]|uniref:Amino acid adenylation domain-containing protein n=1 Tax=Saccharothrix lopnurensis TaxID=1670621 RepID=A0ABW1P848_9PSEU